MTTGIQVMNVGKEAAIVQLNVVASGLAPECEACAAVVPPMGSHTFFPSRDGLMIPAGAWGSATLTAGQPIVALVNDLSMTGVVDSAMYVGIPAGSEVGDGVQCPGRTPGTPTPCALLPVLHRNVASAPVPRARPVSLSNERPSSP
jgi:hypothetical protein